MKSFIGVAGIILAFAAVAPGRAQTIVPIASGFKQPAGLALDGAGNLFVGDFGNNAIKELLAAGGYAGVTTLNGDV